MLGTINKLFERLISALAGLFGIDGIMVPCFSSINGEKRSVVLKRVIFTLYRFGDNTDKMSKWLRPFVHSVDFTGMMKGLKDFFAQVGFLEI